MNSSCWTATTTTTPARPWSQTRTLPEVTRDWGSMPFKMERLAAGFAPISLEQMDAVALLNRIDTKFVLRTGQLLNALTALQNDYWMFAINGHRLNHYRTLYFDTCDFELYHAHVNGRAERYKVRSREYIDSHLSFLEVKHKTNKDRTIKDRIPTTHAATQMTREATRWLHEVSPLDGSTLEPKLWNTFTRMTLVSKHCCERITLDIDLTFYTADQVVRLDGIAIAEAKTDTGNHTSPFFAQMHTQRIHPNGFSKYAIGVAMLYDQVKKNAMKPQLLQIEKMSHLNQ